jgi:fatty acid amide hydrolase 2
MNPLLLQSATALARRIRSREISASEVMEAHLSHIERVNPGLNAIVRPRFAEARREAREADERAARTPPAELPPLHGVPCSIKECFALTGMPQSSGLVARQGVIATRDAVSVARLRAAGCIPVGVTNLSELCMWMESDNRVYGRTNNPYDPTRTVGGSSGGEGAIVGAGGVPFGLGSDVGGSIRMPAFFNGVFGHKPGSGLVPSSGQFPPPHGRAWSYLATGPLTRRAEDLMPLLRLLAGPDGEDPSTREQAIGDPSTVRIDQLRILDVSDNGFLGVTDDLRAAQQRAAGALGRRGAKVVEAQFPELRSSLEIWSTMLAGAGGPTFADLLGNGDELRLLPELGRLLLGRSPYTLPALGLALIEPISKASPRQVARFEQEGEALKRLLQLTLGDDGVMLFPAHTRPAPRHGHPLLPPIQWAYTAIFNVLELPVTQVPLGLNAEGLPLGIQVVGAHGRDDLTIAVALALEQDLGGWVPPPIMGA